MPRQLRKSRSAARRPELRSASQQAIAELLHAHKLSCGVGLPLLTDAGIAHLRTLYMAVNGGTNSAGSIAADLESPDVQGLRPHWDSESRQLWLGPYLLKQFRRQPACNQTLLLHVFEEQGWGCHFDDPLPLATNETAEDGRDRLRQTIKDLNHGLPPGTIRFRGDGTGQGCFWMLEAVMVG